MNFVADCFLVVLVTIFNNPVCIITNHNFCLPLFNCITRSSQVSFEDIKLIAGFLDIFYNIHYRTDFWYIS